MRLQRERDAIVVILCNRKQVIEIIEHVKNRFPDVEVNFEVFQEE